MGAPLNIHNDNSKMQTSKAWNELTNLYNIATSTTEPYHPQQNPAEQRIQTIKARTRAVMDATGAPPSVWLYCVHYVVDILNMTAHAKLNWRTPFEISSGYTPDISPFLHFRFWDSVVYFEQSSFPNSNELMGYWLGVTKNCGDTFTYHVYVPETHRVIASSVLRHFDSE